MIKCLVFDFDGVLVQSNAIKQRAYFDIFVDSLITPDLISRGIALMPSGDRYEVIRSILKQGILAGKMTATPELEKRVQDFALRYGTLCEKSILDCSEVEGVSDVLPPLAKSLPLYINSDTPEEPLRRIVEQRGWTKFFRQILGRPRSKQENLASALRAEAIEGKYLMFCGDRQRDLQAAEDMQCTFIGIRSDANDFREERVLLRNFHELKNAVITQGGLKC